jgi:hypothetical protein
MELAAASPNGRRLARLPQRIEKAMKPTSGRSSSAATNELIEDGTELCKAAVWIVTNGDEQSVVDAHATIGAKKRKQQTARQTLARL